MRSPQIEKLPFKEVYNMRPENLSPQSPNRSRSTNGKSRIFKYQHGSNSQVRQQNNNRPYNAVPTSPTFIQGSADMRGIRKSINNGSRVIGYENINNIPSNFSYTEVNRNSNNNGAASNISYIERLQTEFDGNRHLHTTQNEQKIAQNHMQAEKKSNIKINYMTPTTSEYFRPIVTYSTGSKIRSTTAAQIPLIKHIPVGQLVSGYNNNQPAQPVMATTTITRKPQAITDLSKTSAIIGATNDKNKVIDFDNNANLKNIQIHLQPQSNMMFSPGSELSKAEKAQQHKFISHTIQCSKTPSEIPQSIFSNNISMMPVHAYRPAPTSIGVNTNEVGRLSSIVITNRDDKIMQNKQELVIAGIQPKQQNQVGSSLRYEFKIRTNEMAGNAEANDKLPIKVSNSSEMPTVTSSLRYHKINPDNSISSSAANSSIRLMNVNNNYNAVNSSNSVTKNGVTTNCGKNSPRYVYNGYSATTANLTKSNQAVSELKNTNTQVNKNAIQLTSSNSNEIIKSIPNSFSNPTAVYKPPFTQNQNMNAQFVKRQLGRNFMSSFPSNLSANEQSTSNQNNPIHTIGVSNNISFDIQNNPFALSTPSTHQNKSGSMDVSQVRRIQHIPVQITSKKDNAIVEMQCQPLSNQLSQVSQSISFPQPHTITQIYRPSSNNPIYSRTITKVHPQPVASYTTIRPLTPYGKQYTIPSHYQLSSQIQPQLHYQFEERPTYVSASRQHSQPPDSLLQPLQLDFMDYVQKNRNNRNKIDIQQMRNQAIQPKRQPQIPQYSSYIQSAIPPSFYIPSYSGINSRPEFNNRIIYSNSAYPQKHSQDSAIKLDRRGAQTDRQKKDEVENNSRSRSRSRSRVNIFDFVKDPNRQSRFSHQVISSKAKKQEEIKFQPHTVLSPKNVKHEKYEPRHNYRISIASNESRNKDEEEDIKKNLRIPQQPGEKNRMSSENEESSNQQDRKSKWRQRLSRDKIKRFFSRSKGKEVNNEKEKRNNNDNEKQEDQQKQEEGQDFEQGEEQGQRGEGKQRKGKWRNRVKGFFGKARGKKGESEQKSKQNQQQDDNDNESQQQEQQSKWRSKLSTNPIKGLIHKIRGNKDKKDKTQGQQEQAQEDDNEKDNDNQNKQGQSRWRDKFSRKKIKGLFSRSHGKEDKNTKAQQKKDRNEQEGEEEDGKEKGKWRKKVKGLINKVRGKDEVGDHQKKANQKQKSDKKDYKQKSEKSKEKKGKQLVSIKSAQNNKNDAKQADGNVSDDENSGGWKRYFDESVQGVIKRLDTVGTTVKQLLAPKKQQPQSKYQTWKTQKGQQSPLPRNIDRRLTIRDEFGTNYLKSPQQYSSPPQISADFDQMNQFSLSDIKQKDDVMNRSSSSRGAHKTKKQSEQKKVSKSNKTLGNQQQRNQDMKGKPQQKKEGLSFLEIFMIAGLIGIGVAMVMFQILR